jgi:peptidoglycan/xylan/chitin deacetylase (PgdA/CDA1 family)
LILLSFDIEEFDMPMEYGKTIPLKEQIEISALGTSHILDILDRQQVKATFFSTVVFAENAPDLIQRIKKSGHELASHGYYHSDFELSHLSLSRDALNAISGNNIQGFRMARMMPVDENEIVKAGYLYNSSVNPTWIPGRYNNLQKPRSFYKEAGIWQIPASVSPVLRFPLFWLSFHNLPLRIYKWLADITIKKDGYLNIYFHPWEFTSINIEKFGLPKFVSKNCGAKMISRMEDFISTFKRKNHRFYTFSEFVKTLSSDTSKRSDSMI